MNDWMQCFRDQKLIESLVFQIRQNFKKLGRKISVMEVCGGHTHAIVRYGLDRLLEAPVEFLHGPGCPVCIIPKERINAALQLARQKNVILTTLGDMARVPGSSGSLQDLRARGYDIRFLYSPAENIEIARSFPDKRVVYFAIGFETTTPMSAYLLEKISEYKIRNLFLYVNHVLVIPPMEALLSDPDHRIEAFLGPSHVSVVAGGEIYRPLSQKFRVPVSVCGFEPADILEGVLQIQQMLLDDKPQVQIQYRRAADLKGNTRARAMVEKYFETAESFNWRGLGEIPDSSLKLKEEFSAYDARKVFDQNIISETAEDVKNCLCPEILKGKAKPFQCKLFKKACHPDNPMGACMVSTEGACSAYFHYGETA